MSSLSLEDKIQVFIDTAKSNSGSLPVDEALCREMAILNVERMQNTESPKNHYRAIIASHDLHAAAPSKITAHTHIVHGDEDPIFPLEHGMTTHAAISKSTISIIPGFGHHLSNKELLLSIATYIVSIVQKSSSQYLNR
jgi:pimeloyl-ACP methyl ester carboxylesterase